jgi:ribosomal protein L37AE/L43A
VPSFLLLSELARTNVVSIGCQPGYVRSRQFGHDYKPFHGAAISLAQRANLDCPDCKATLAKKPEQLSLWIDSDISAVGFKITIPSPFITNKIDKHVCPICEVLTDVP